jgi:hypothetical protein
VWTRKCPLRPHYFSQWLPRHRARTIQRHPFQPRCLAHCRQELRLEGGGGLLRHGADPTPSSSKTCSCGNDWRKQHWQIGLDHCLGRPHGQIAIARQNVSRAANIFAVGSSGWRPLCGLRFVAGNSRNDYWRRRRRRPRRLGPITRRLFHCWPRSSRSRQWAPWRFDTRQIPHLNQTRCGATSLDWGIGLAPWHSFHCKATWRAAYWSAREPRAPFQIRSPQ